MTGKEAERLLHTEFARRLRKPFRQAIERYRLLRAGDRVAVCVSGGKDSMALAVLLRDLGRELPLHLEYLAMDPGYTPEHRQGIERNAERFSLPLRFFQTDVLRIAGNHAPEHPCFLCAKMRRGHLYAEAQRLGCTKIALGHHYDDAIETVLMGLLYGGQVQAMLPRLQSKHYAGMELIRPLYQVREQAVRDWAEACGLTFSPCGCPAAQRGADTIRAAVKSLIARLAAENPQVEKNILNAVKSVDTAKLLGWRADGIRHSFLDVFAETDGEPRAAVSDGNCDG